MVYIVNAVYTIYAVMAILDGLTLLSGHSVNQCHKRPALALWLQWVGMFGGVGWFHVFSNCETLHSPQLG